MYFGNSSKKIRCVIKGKNNYLIFILNSLDKRFIKCGKGIFSYKLSVNFIFLLSKYYGISKVKVLEKIYFVFLKNRPLIGYKLKRFGARKVQLPAPITVKKGLVLLLNWFCLAISRRSGNLMERLFYEFIDLENNKGSTFSRVENFYSVLEKNRPFFKPFKGGGLRKKRISYRR